ncbi:hypothetical protein [Streptomyces virginiae]|uniref:hypothetical protein n=1 Tax=Streptomyces virginiae TaxID=1961 RepID=UPI0004C72CC7|nr:hypothetical protein [Streptomyces virginiae]
MAAPALALSEEWRAEGLACRVIEILADPVNPSRRSLPAYQLSARLAFATAAASSIQPGDCPCDWCGQGGSDPIDPQDGE